jgi:hypothetical protein
MHTFKDLAPIRDIYLRTRHLERRGRARGGGGGGVHRRCPPAATQKVNQWFAPFGVWFVLVFWFAVWRLVCRPLVCRLASGLSSSGLSELTTKGKNLIPFLALFLLQTKNELDVEEPDGDAGRCQAPRC